MKLHDEPRDDFLARLEVVREQLTKLASSTYAPAAQTDPDPTGSETWTAGNVFAHIGEFPSYWLREASMVADTFNGKPVPFGRTKQDPHRKEVIIRDAARSPQEIMDQIAPELDGLRNFIADLPPDGWEATGLHETLGPMPMSRIVDEFLIGHLEEHARQLELLLTRS